MTNILIAFGVLIFFTLIYDFAKKERQKLRHLKKLKEWSDLGEKRRANYGKEYKDLDEVFSSSSYNDENIFIKTLLDKEDGLLDRHSKGFIEDHYSQFDGGEIWSKIELLNQMEHIHSVYLKDWKKKKNLDFKGFDEIKQHRSIIKMIMPVLEELNQRNMINLLNK